MYGAWILAIIFASLFVVSCIMCVVSIYLNDKYYDLYINAVEGSKEEAFYKDRKNAWDGCAVVFFTLAAVFLTITILVCVCGGIGIVGAKREILEFEQTKLIVEDAYKNGTDLDNIGMTHTIIEQNEWLKNAKVGLTLYGNFSRYYGTQINTMQYISVGGAA